MASYSVHLPADAPAGDPGALDRLVVVRDGFAVFAFAFHVLWFLWHRLWLASLAVLAVMVATGLMTDGLGLPGVAAVAIQVLVSLLIGLEASSLRRWTLRRKGLPMRDIVIADNVAQAEDKAIARWLARGSGMLSGVTGSQPAAAPARPGPYPVAAGVPVIGLFPQPGGRA